MRRKHIGTIALTIYKHRHHYHVYGYRSQSRYNNIGYRYITVKYYNIGINYTLNLYKNVVIINNISITSSLTILIILVLRCYCKQSETLKKVQTILTNCYFYNCVELSIVNDSH